MQSPHLKLLARHHLLLPALLTPQGTSVAATASAPGDFGEAGEEAQVWNAVVDGLLK